MIPLIWIHLQWRMKPHFWSPLSLKDMPVLLKWRIYMCLLMIQRSMWGDMLVTMSQLRLVLLCYVISSGIGKSCFLMYHWQWVSEWVSQSVSQSNGWSVSLSVNKLSKQSSKETVSHAVSQSVISNFLSVSQSTSWPASELVGREVVRLANLQNKTSSQSICHFFSWIWTCKNTKLVQKHKLP